jgi:hypothetical protein
MNTPESLHNTTEVREKAKQIEALSEALDRAKAAHKACPTYDTAVSIQKIALQRRGLRALMPPIQLVSRH